MTKQTAIVLVVRAPRRTSGELSAIREQVLLRARDQGGVFRRSDLAMWGIEPTVVLTMRRNGSWVRLHHGVYCDRDTAASATDPTAEHLLRAAAAVAAIPGAVALFGPTAALLHGIPVDRQCLHTLELVRPVGRDSRALRRRVSARDRLPAAVVHILAISEDEIIGRQGLPTVGPELAAWSSARVSEPDWGVVSIDSVAWQSQETLDRMQGFGERWSRLKGAGTARAALSLARTGAQSPLESLSRVRLVRAGLPEPSLQVPLYDGDGLIGYVDMLFEGLGVVGEADGRGKYASRNDLVKEKVREDRIRAEGFGVVRWNWKDAQGDMRTVAARIQRAAVHSRRGSA